MLRTHPGLEVIGEFSEGYELVKLPGTIAPDIIITDLYLPAINNSNPTSLIHQWNPTLRVLVISDTLSPMQAIRTLRNGALGYVVRYEDFDHLILAIHTVVEGRRYVSGLVTEQILNEVISGKNYEKESDDRISNREREILQLVAEGKTNAEIGKLLVISTRTVETHRNNLMRKLGLSSQIEIIRYALKQGLLSLE